MTKNNLFRFFLIVLISVFFLFSRIKNLTSLPVFGDEAIYIRWAQIIQTEEGLRFVPQTDGKQPLFMWINAITLKLISDPLISGRIISVFSGFTIMSFLFLTTAIFLNYHSKENNIFKFIKQSLNQYFYQSIFTALIYCLIPFSFFFDRLALADNLLSAFGLMSLFLSILLSKYPRLDISLILGAVLGLSWLTKSPAIYFIFLSFATFIFFNYRQIKLIVFPLISSIVAFIIYNILRLGPQFHMIALRNKDYVWPISEIIKHPLDPLKPHLLNASNLYLNYLSITLIVFTAVGTIFFFLNKRNHQSNNFKYLILFSWWILPLLANAGIAKVFTARYILFTLPPLVILISLFLNSFFQKINNKVFKLLIFIAIFIPNLNFIYKISTNPFKHYQLSPEPGYFSNWTSGWGIEESAIFLKERSLFANVIVGTEGSFGTLPDGLQIYGNKIPQLTIIGVGLGFSEIPPNLIDAKNYGDEVYLLINESRLKLNTLEIDKLELIKSYDKPDQDKLLLYKI